MTHCKESDFESFPPTYRIVNYWRNRTEFAPAFDNEPCCFACKNGVHAWGELQRAHLVASCHSGSFEPNNFVLLCLTCHREQPMVDDYEMQLGWVRRHPHFTQPITDAIQAIHDLENYGFSIRDDDPERFGEFLEARRLRFHPHSTVADKMRAIMFVLGEYLKVRSQVLP